MYDQELYELIQVENEHYLNAIDLIAAFNAPPPSVRVNEAWGVAQFRSTEGLLGRKPYAGNQYFDAIEALAARRACELFGAEHCNVQPLSGSQANLAVYKALLKPGDKILSMSLQSGGHLTHGLEKHVVRDLYNIVHYTVEPDTFLLNYDRIQQMAEAEKPQLIIAGYSAYPRAVDFARFQAIGDSVGARVLADISHIAGFVATGLHPNPCDYGMVVTGSVKKTLRGVHGAFILCPNDFAEAIDRGLFPGYQSSIGLSDIVGLAHVFFEASSEEFRTYARHTLDYARRMAAIFQRRGISLIASGTDTHMVVLHLGPLGLTGREVEQRLEAIGILANRNVIPFDPRPPYQASGLRIGTNTVTARGFEPHEIETVANMIADVVLASDWTDALKSELATRVAELVNRPRGSDTLRDLKRLQRRALADPNS